MLLNNLLEETSKQRNQKIVFLDIDDTLLTAKNIFILKKKDGKEVGKLTPQQYADVSNVQKAEDRDNGIEYSYEQFNDPLKVYSSIKDGTPILSNLKSIDNLINTGWTLGVITARGMNKQVIDGLKDFLQYRDANKVLRKIGTKLQDHRIFTVNDEKFLSDDYYNSLSEKMFGKKLKEVSDANRKVLVMKDFQKKGWRILFVDDDLKNIEFAKKHNIKTIQANKPK